MNKEKHISTSKRYYRQKKLFSNIHILIAIVAIIECLLLITFTTYSWIESASSLIITDEIEFTTTDPKLNKTPMNVTGTLNYKFNITNDSTDNYIDLSSYFSDIKYYQYARASSTNGYEFYFPRATETVNGNKQSGSTYRKGDTTDINTSYTYLYFEVSNNSNKNYGYLFELQKNGSDYLNMITLSDPSNTLDDTILSNCANAFRISISSNSNASIANTHIYSNLGGNTTTVSSINSTGMVTTGTQVARKYSDYGAINGSDPSHNPTTLFTINKGGNTTFASLRIWLEDKAIPSELTQAQKNALLGCNVNVNLKLMTSDNVKSNIVFDDYTFSELTLPKGMHITEEHSESENYRVVLKLYDTAVSKYKYYPLKSIGVSTNGSLRWSTCTSEGEVTGTIPGDLIEKLNSTASTWQNSYFFYGTYDLTNSANAPGTTAPSCTETYKWKQFSRALPSNTSEGNLYNAYSFTTNGTTPYGVGDWGDKALTLVKFRDQDINNTESAYNSESEFRFIDKSAELGNSKTMFVNQQSSAGDYYKTPTLYFDNSNVDAPCWKTYLPVEWLGNSNSPGTLYFRYYISQNYNGVANITYAAALDSVAITDNNRTFTGLGYSQNKLVTDISSGTLTGLGTWGQTEPIKLSTELIDNEINPAYRYKVSFDGGTNFVSMTPLDDLLTYCAYIPQGYGVSGTSIKFEKLNTFNANSHSALWTTTNRLSSTNLYFAINTNGSSASGSWKVAVLVDGTYDNLINDTLTDTGILGYKLSLGDSYTDAGMVQLDDYRWVVNLSESDTDIWFKWEPYTNTIFEKHLNVSNDIYCVITE